MNFKQRYNIATEEAGAEVIPTEPDTVSDVIEEVEATDELNEIQNNVVADQAAMEEAEAVVNELESQVEDNEALLEQHPEAITDDVVAASQESYYNTIGRLGFKIEDARVSVEGASDPIGRFRLSTEGVKEFVIELINKVKELAKKFIMWIKKMWNKITFLEKRLAKKAQELEKDYERVHLAGKNVVGSNAQVPMKYIPAIFSRLKGSIHYKDFEKMHDPVAAVDGFSKALKFINDQASKLTAEGATEDDKEKIHKAIDDKMEKAFEFMFQMKLPLQNENIPEFDKADDVVMYSTNGKVIRWIALKEGKALTGNLGPNERFTNLNIDILFKTREVTASLKLLQQRLTKDKLSLKVESFAVSIEKELDKLISNSNVVGHGNMQLSDDKVNVTEKEQVYILLSKVLMNFYNKTLVKVLPDISLDNITLIKNYINMYNAVYNNAPEANPKS